MQYSSEHTAILLFASDAREEANRKAWLGAPRKKANIRLSRTLTRQAKQMAEKTGLPVFHVSSREQLGESFGERLQHAFSSIYAKGFQRVLAIGNDCPELTSLDLVQAAHMLGRFPVVSGATPEGGIYLLGLQKEAFLDLAFEDLPWSQPHLFEALQRLSSDSDLHLWAMNPRDDLNTRQDLIRSWHLLARLEDVSRWLSALLFSPDKAYVLEITPRIISGRTVSRLHRGPPYQA